MEWQPIETEPESGVKIDIWVSGLGRIANVTHWRAYYGVTHWMPLPSAPEAQAMSRRDDLEALRDKIVWVEGRRRVAISRAKAIVAPEDGEVQALCERHGYGAVMDAASRLWCQKHGTSAMFVGGCIGDKSLHEALEIIDTLIAEEKDQPHD